LAENAEKTVDFI
jgi:hypothetical protein